MLIELYREHDSENILFGDYNIVNSTYKFLGFTRGWAT